MNYTSPSSVETRKNRDQASAAGRTQILGDAVGLFLELDDGLAQPAGHVGELVPEQEKRDDEQDDDFTGAQTKHAETPVTDATPEASVPAERAEWRAGAETCLRGVGATTPCGDVRITERFELYRTSGQTGNRKFNPNRAPGFRPADPF